MIPDMRRLLQRLQTGRGEPEFFSKPVMLVHECQGAIDTACTKLGIVLITHHDLRHLFATRCIESGLIYRQSVAGSATRMAALRFGRDVRAERKIRGIPWRTHRRHFHLRAGIQLHHLAAQLFSLGSIASALCGYKYCFGVRLSSLGSIWCWNCRFYFKRLFMRILIFIFFFLSSGR